MLPVQSFAGSGIIRGIGSVQRPIQEALSEAKFLLVAGRSVCLNKTTVSVAWMTSADLRSLGFTFEFCSSSVGVGGGGEESAFALWQGDPEQKAPLLFLGKDDDRQQEAEASIYKTYIAIDCSTFVKTPDLQQALFTCGCSLQDLRPAMFSLSASSPRDLSLAGYAAALSQWHQANLYCAKCGSPTTPAKGGAKRQCTRDTNHTAYPRTDPVVIMLVESPSEDRVLLGRSRKAPRGMLSCLAGFIDIGESIEEAVQREVHEESGIVIDPSSVRIVGSQPWPLGRGSSHELMIGCIARARGVDLIVDPLEMEECRWVGVDELQSALGTSTSPESPYLGGRGAAKVENSSAFYVPPPLAIAHHLLNLWVQKKTNASPIESSLPHPNSSL